jgi:hypothetical protein
MTEAKRQVQTVKDVSDVKFCLHDLRRVFKSIAQGVVTISENHNLTNHTSKNAGDGYIILPIDKLRKPMQKISDRILTIVKSKKVLQGNAA